VTWIKDKVLAIINGDHLLDEREFEHLCLHIAQMQGIVQEIDASSGVAGLGAIDPVPETAFKLMTSPTFHRLKPKPSFTHLAQLQEPQVDVLSKT